MPFGATWMDLEMIILSEVRQRKTNIMWYHLYVESKKWCKWIYKTERDSQTPGNKLVTKGDKWGVKTQLLYMWKNNKDLPYSSGNCTQYLIITYNGEESEKEHTHTHTHTYESPLLLFSHQVMSDSLRPHGHARPSCPTPSPGVCPSSCPLNQWWITLLYT